MLQSEPSDCCPRSQVPATRSRSVRLWKPVLPPAPEGAEAAQPRVGPARSVRRRETVFQPRRRGGTDRIYGSPPLAEWIPFGNISQLFRDKFTTLRGGGFMLWRFQRMTKRRAMEKDDERKSGHSNA